MLNEITLRRELARISSEMIDGGGFAYRRPCNRSNGHTPNKL